MLSLVINYKEKINSFMNSIRYFLISEVYELFLKCHIRSEGITLPLFVVKILSQAKAYFLTYIIGNTYTLR